MVSIEFGEQLLITAIGVGIGVLLGGYATLRIQQKMDKDSRQKSIKNVKNSIKEELSNAKEGIEKFKKKSVEWNDQNQEFRGEKPLILTPAYDSAINSGNFSLLDSSLQTEIPSAYLSIDAINLYTDLIRKFIFHAILPYNTDNPHYIPLSQLSICYMIDPQTTPKHDYAF